MIFLFTDIEGSTRLWEEHFDAMRQALARHTELIVAAVQAHGGILVRARGEGDSTFSVFESAPEAVAAACDFQRAFAQEAWPDEVRLKVRAALHLGSAHFMAGDYNSADVNRCARVRSLAHGQQTLLTEAVYAGISERLPDGAACRDLGLHRLKDLRDPERIYQLCHPDLRAEFPPLLSLSTLPNNLPRQLTSFVGRDAELKAVKEMLAQAPLLTLLGAGGAGKTRLALQAAADTMERYPHGVWLVELAALTDPVFVPQAAASALGLREEPGRALTQTLTEYLASRKVLLLLDNCEHLLDACASLADTLLRACPNLTVLATSRAPLGIAGEHPWRVPSLTAPDPDSLPPDEKGISGLLLEYDAPRLFVERARIQRPEFVLSRGNAPTVARLCRRLDGIPLALELAAARIRTLPVEQIETRLDERFQLLTGGSRTALPRQQTLRALIDWSYDLLTEDERLLLRRVSVFAGGWTLEAAESVCAGEGLEDWQILDLLTSLADKSLVTYEECEGKSRYGLLETIRQYGQEKVSQPELWRSKHREWCLRLVEAAAPNLLGADSAIWLNRLHIEHDNLRSALAWCRQTGDGISALRMTGILWRFWLAQGDMSEGRNFCEIALETAGADALPEARALTLNGLGNLAFMECDYVAAQSRFQECLEIGLAADDQSRIALSQTNLASVAIYAGRPAEARVLLEESLVVFRRMGDNKGTANALANLGQLTLRERDLEGAQAALEECAALYRGLGNPIAFGTAQGNLGILALRQKDYAAAQERFEEALAIFREQHFVYGIAVSLSSLGETLTEQGNFGAARGLLCESLVLMRDIGDKDSVAGALEWLAVTDHARGQSAQAARLGGAAEALRESIGSPLPPEGKREHEQRMNVVRDALGEAVFAAEWATGRAMPWEQAVEYALAGQAG